MFPSGGLSPINSSFANCQDFSSWIEDRKKGEEEDLNTHEQSATSQDPLPSTPSVETATLGQAAQNGSIYNPTEEEIKEVIVGSRIEWTPDSLRLLRGGSDQEFPDCFDHTPLKAKVANEVISPDTTDYPNFIQEFSRMYNELLIHMEFTDEQLLAYSRSEREDLLILINVFHSNVCHIRSKDYDQGYDDLITLLNNRFVLQEEFADYFPQHEDT